MVVRTESIDKWVRAWHADSAIVDSRSPLLFWEPQFPVPSYAFPTEDVRTDLFRISVARPPEQPFFYLPKGPVSTWYDLVVGGRVVPFAGWERDDPALAGRVVLSWQPGLLDRWVEEEEEVFEHPRDPHKRVEVLLSSRHVTVAVNGRVVADSRSPVLLFETDLPTRYYLPLSDVDDSALSPTDNRSRCPYKGTADRYWDVGGTLKNAAWSYSAPSAAVEKVAGRIAFYNELVDITVDGSAIARPLSPFSDAANRPES